jgi:Sigma-70, region 4
MSGLQDISAEHRAIVELVLEKGQSYPDIARTLGLPEERVRAMAREASEELRGGGEKEGREDREERGEGQFDLIVMFSIYLILIVAGLAYFIVIGLEHH